MREYKTRRYRSMSQVKIDCHVSARNLADTLDPPMMLSKM
jgi:hypothetical protein